MTDEERRRIAAERKAAYRRRKKAEANLSDKLPTPEATFPPGVLYVDSREKAEAAVSEAVAREEMVALLFKPYAKSTNLPELLQGIIRELITLRVNLTDLIGGLRK